MVDWCNNCGYFYSDELEVSGNRPDLFFGKDDYKENKAPFIILEDFKTKVCPICNCADVNYRSLI